MTIQESLAACIRSTLGINNGNHDTSNLLGSPVLDGLRLSLLISGY